MIIILMKNKEKLPKMYKEILEEILSEELEKLSFRYNLG